ncbi:MAG: universal stress protein [Syntrophomonadaceae bacterium]
MYNKVLLAVDGSPTSTEAARTANMLLEKGMAQKVEVIHVVPNLINSYYDMGGDMIKSLSEQTQEKGKEILRLTTEMFSMPEKVQTVFRIGDTAETICEYAKKNGVDLIIVGSRGMNPLAGLLVGSVSSRIIHFAPCPVLVVKPH